ncbi:MAG: hypothetical protein GXP55_02670 [Deltaproteobacteria bacterium]|nr:hypothetical protein [Deltaproteobacteria bacterium]
MKRSPLFLALVMLTACGSAPAASTTTPDSSPTSGVDAMAYLPADTAWMARLDLDSLRRSALGDAVDSWVGMLAEDLGARTSDGLADALLGYWRATSSVLIGVVPDARARGLLDMQLVVVTRGAYEPSALEAWARVMAERTPQLRSERIDGRLVLRTERDAHFSALAADAQTVVWARAVSPDRLLAIAGGAAPAHGRIDGLRALARDGGFGSHSFDLLTLAESTFLQHLPGSLDRPTAQALDGFSGYVSLGAGADGELRVHTATPAAAQALLVHVARFREIAVALERSEPVIAQALRSLEWSTEGVDVRAHFVLDAAQRQALVTRIDALIRADLDQPLAGASTPADAASNFALMCQLTTQLQAEDISPDQRAAELARRLFQQLTNRDVRRVFEALANADADSRYSLLRAAAAELGVEDFRCAALE